MKPVTTLSKIVFLLFIITSCQKEPLPKPQPDPQYSTIYKPLTTAEWETRNAEFQKINIYEGLSLNEYGFVEGEIPLQENDTLSEDLVINTVESLFNRFEKYLGLPENITINYEEQLGINVPYMVPFGRESVKHFFKILEEHGNESWWNEIMEGFKYDFLISQINIGNTRFLGPDIHFYFKMDEKKLVLSNNWFPEAVVPENEIYTLDDIIPLACRVYKKQTGLDFWETKHEFATVKIMTQNKTESGTEIRECWRINTLINKYTYGDLFIDTQTGEVIKYQERVIYVY